MSRQHDEFAELRSPPFWFVTVLVLFYAFSPLVDEPRIEMADDRWGVHCFDGCRARVAGTPENLQGPVQVAIVRRMGERTDQIRLRRRIALEGNATYELTFVARAAAPRPVTVWIGHAHPPWNTFASATWDLHQTEQTCRLQFTSEIADDDLWLAFDLAAADATVWLDQIDLRKVEWSLTATAPAAARWVPGGEPTTSGTGSIGTTITRPACAIEVANGGHRPDDLLLRTELGTLVAEARYEVRLMARADVPAEVQCRIERAPHGEQGDPSPSDVAFDEPLRLAPEWTHYRFEILANRMFANASLALALGNAAGRIELRGIELRPLDANPVSSRTR